MKSSINSKKSVLRAFGVISSMTFLSRVTGYARDACIAAVLGTTWFSDAFFVAFRIPNMFRRLLGEGALTPAIVPVATGLSDREKREKDSEIRSIITFFTGTVFLVTVTGMIFSPLIVRVIAMGFAEKGEVFDVAVRLTRLMFPYLFCISLVAVYMGLLNASHHYFAPSFSPVLLNLSMISGLGLLYWFDILHVYALAAGVLAGGILQVLFQIPFLRREGIPVLPGPVWRTGSSLAVYRLLLPSVFGLAITQINVLVDTMVATLLHEGAVSQLYYADRLLELPMGLFTISFATALLPSVSKLASDGDEDGLRVNFTRTLSYCLFFIVPSAFFLLCMGKPVLALLFKRKAFEAVALEGSFMALAGFAWGLPFFTFNRLVTQLFYAHRNTREPVKTGFVAMVVNCTMDFILMPLGVFGLASATSIAAGVNSIMLMRAFGKSHFSLRLRDLSGGFARMLVAGTGAGISAYGAHSLMAAGAETSFFMQLAGLVLSLVVFCAVYPGLLLATGSREMREIWKTIGRRLQK